MNPLSEKEMKYLKRAVALAQTGMEQGLGGPFGCVIVKNDKIVGEGCNQVLATNDPTAHAEVVAIRDACKNLAVYQLTDCDVYSSCEPCPMCLGAIYWARPNKVIFANTRQQAAAIEFDDNFIYNEINTEMSGRKIPFIHVPDEEAAFLFEKWKSWDGKKAY
jgi:guanine deaminase